MFLGRHSGIGAASKYRPTMHLLKIAVTVLSLAFGSVHQSSFRQSGSAQPTSAKLVSWRGETGDLSLDLKFEQVGDSLYGRGTYRVGPGRRVGCGGETLFRTGYLTMRSGGNRASFRGKLFFDAGWMPPVSGTQTSNGSVKLRIRSVDKGNCIVTLDRWEKTVPLR